MRGWYKAMERRRALKQAEANGEIADSQQVRMAIMARFHSGEWTLEQCQAELSRVQREGRKTGKATRASFR